VEGSLLITQGILVMKWQLTILILLSSVASSYIAAEEDGINDDKNFLGDRISFPINIKAAYEKNDGTQQDICIPASVSLRGLGKVDNDTLIVKLATIKETVKDCSDEGIDIPSYHKITLPSEVMTKLTPNRFGLTYGSLVVPYKYHVSGSKSFNGNSTIGPYLGYRFDKNGTLGAAVKVVAFVGGSVTEVTRTVDGEEKTDSLAGLSYGLGLIGEIKNEFQFGAVAGADRVSAGSGYDDNGKIWVALALGFSFSK